MGFLDKIFGKQANVDLLEAPESKVALESGRSEIPQGSDLKGRINAFVKEVERQPLPRKSGSGPNVMVADKDGGYLHIDEYRDKEKGISSERVASIRQEIKAKMAEKEELPNMSPVEDSVESDDAEKEAMIAEVESFDGLISAVEGLGMIQGASKAFDAQEMKARLESYRAGGAGEETITRTFGLRAKAKELLAKERKASDVPVRTKVSPVKVSSVDSSVEIAKLNKEIEELDRKIADPEAGVSNQGLAEAIVAKERATKEAGFESLKAKVAAADSFDRLRQTLVGSGHPEEAAMVSTIDRAEAVVNGSYQKGENFQSLSPEFVNQIPNVFGLPERIRRISSETFAKLHGETREPRRPSQRSRIILPNERPVEEKKAVSPIDDLKAKIAAADDSPEMVEKRRLQEEQGAVVRVNLQRAAEAQAATDKIEAERKMREAEEEKFKKLRWLDPNKVGTHPRGYEPKNIDIDKEVEDFHKALEVRAQTNVDSEVVKNDVSDRPSGQGSVAESVVADEVESRPWRIEDKRSVKAQANESLTLGAAEVISAMEASLGEDKFDVEAAKGMLKPEPVAPESESSDKERNEVFWRKAKLAMKTPSLWKEVAKAGVGSAASILGFKAFYDVPAYFKQRYAVRGNVFGFGSGKGLSGSIDELIAASQLKKGAMERGDETEKGVVLEAIKDLDRRLADTKEGSKKGSEQRKRIATLLWENRHRNKQKIEDRTREINNVLDNYTTTKVSGIQAARETLNTALVASGAFTLRGVAYGGLAYFEKLEEVRREARIKMTEADPKADKKVIKRTVEEEVGFKQAFARGLKETYEGIRLKSGGNKFQRGLAAIKSYGSIARFVGIALGVSSGGNAYGASLDKVIDALSGKESFSDAGRNFVDNADRYIPDFGSVSAAELPKGDAFKGIEASVEGDDTTTVEQLPETINRLDDVLKRPIPESFVPMNKAGEVLPTEEVTAAIGSPEHIKAFLDDPESKGKLSEISGKAKVYFDNSNKWPDRTKALDELNVIKRAIETELGGRLAFEHDGTVKLKMPDGSSSTLFSPESTSKEPVGNVAEEVKEVVAAKPAEPERGVVKEELDFADAFEEEESKRPEEVVTKEYSSGKENSLNGSDKVEDTPPSPQNFRPLGTRGEVKVTENLSKENGSKVTDVANSELSSKRIEGLNVKTSSSDAGVEVFAGGKMSGFTGQEHLNKDVVDKMNLSPMDKRALEMSARNVSLLAEKLKTLDSESQEAASLRKAISGIIRGAEGRFGANVFSDDFKEPALEKMPAVDHPEPRNFKPLENAVAGRTEVTERIPANDSPEEVPAMTPEEAKNFDQPLNDPKLAESLVKQGAYVNLRKVPELSKDVLRFFSAQNKTFNLLGLDPERLDDESCRLIKGFKNKPLLSDEVLRRIESVS